MSRLSAIVGRFATARDPWMRSPSALCMPDRFDREARMASFMAHEKAREHGTNAVDADHLLLSILDRPEIREALVRMRVEVQRVESLIYGRIRPDSRDLSRDGVLPRSSILHLTWRIAHELADAEASMQITPALLLRAVAGAIRVAPDRELSELLLAVT